jgi:hypothetical protein
VQNKTRTGLGVAAAVLGVLCLAAAAILAWVVVPKQAQLPGDTNVTRQYAGTAKLLLNAQALAGGQLSQAVLRNIPITAQRTVQVVATDGSAAQVRDSRTLATANGQQLGGTQTTYAVDRKTLEPPSSYPTSWNVTQQQGLTVSWPFGSEKADYTGWVNETQSTTPIKYLREENRKGVDTYVYQANPAAAPIKDPQVLATLPQALPVSALSALASALDIPDELRAKLAQALPALTQPVPLTYTYEAQSTYWVSPATGEVVDTQREEIRKAGLSLPSGQSIAAVIPIYDVTTAFTDDSAKTAAQDANDNADKIQLYGTTLPLILLIVGIVALIIAALLFFLPRREPAPGPIQPGSRAGP